MLFPLALGATEVPWRLRVLRRALHLILLSEWLRGLFWGSSHPRVMARLSWVLPCLALANEGVEHLWELEGADIQLLQTRMESFRGPNIEAG